MCTFFFSLIVKKIGWDIVVWPFGGENQDLSDKGLFPDRGGAATQIPDKGDCEYLKIFGFC